MIVEKFWVLCFFSADFLLCDLFVKMTRRFFFASTHRQFVQKIDVGQWMGVRVRETHADDTDLEIHMKRRRAFHCVRGCTHIYTHTGRTVRSLPYKSQFNLHSFFVRSEASLPPLECYPIEKDLKQYKLNSCSFFCATWVTVRDRFRCACYVLSSGALKMRRWIADFEIYLVLGRLWALTATTTAKKKWHVFFYPFVCFIRFALVAHIVPIVDSRLFEFNRSRNDFSDEGNYFQRWFASS